MSSYLIVTFCNKRAGWLAPPQHPWAPALITSLPPVHVCPDVLSAAEWEELNQLSQKYETSLVPALRSCLPGIKGATISEYAIT